MRCSPAFVVLSAVIAGLDPAIHLFAQVMDALVKPAHDSGA
jgi:hypothetical protein